MQLRLDRQLLARRVSACRQERHKQTRSGLSCPIIPYVASGTPNTTNGHEARQRSDNGEAASTNTQHAGSLAHLHERRWGLHPEGSHARQAMRQRLGPKLLSSANSRITPLRAPVGTRQRLAQSSQRPDSHGQGISTAQGQLSLQVCCQRHQVGPVRHIPAGISSHRQSQSGVHLAACGRLLL
jgi:hypothetical protein